MKAIATNFLPATIDDNNYFGLSIEEETAKKSYRAFFCHVVVILRRISPIDIIVSGNFAYFAERELHAAAEECGLPFVVLHKENLKSPARQDYFEDLYRHRRGPFSGRRIVVYNAFEKQVQTAAGVVRPDQVTVCGMPRLDFAHGWRRGAKEHPECVLAAGNSEQLRGAAVREPALMRGGIRCRVARQSAIRSTAWPGTRTGAIALLVSVSRHRMRR